MPEIETPQEAVGEARIRMPGEVANCFAHLTKLVDEAKIRVDKETLTLETTHVEPANVAMAQLRMSLDTDLGVDEVTLPESDLVTGINLAWLRGRVKWARKAPSGGDPVTLILRDRDAEVTAKNTIIVEREVTRESSRAALNPDSIRKEPDLPDIPNMQVCHTDPIDGVTFYRAVQAIHQAGHDHCSMQGRAQDGKVTGDLVVTSEGDVEDEEVRIEGVLQQGEWDAEASSLYSTDYLWDIAQAIKKSRVGRCWLDYGAECPISIHYQSEQWGIEGQFMLAPRIRSD